MGGESRSVQVGGGFYISFDTRWSQSDWEQAASRALRLVQVCQLLPPGPPPHTIQHIMPVKYLLMEKVTVPLRSTKSANYPVAAGFTMTAWRRVGLAMTELSVAEEVAWEPERGAMVWV